MYTGISYPFSLSTATMYHYVCRLSQLNLNYRYDILRADLKQLQDSTVKSDMTGTGCSLVYSVTPSPSLHTTKTERKRRVHAISSSIDLLTPSVRCGNDPRAHKKMGMQPIEIIPPYDTM